MGKWMRWIQFSRNVAVSVPEGFTHLPRDQLDAISQTTFSNAFWWMKENAFRYEFHWSLFLRVQLIKSWHWFKLWLGAEQATSHYLNQCLSSSLIQKTAPGGDELRYLNRNSHHIACGLSIYLILLCCIALWINGYDYNVFERFHAYTIYHLLHDRSYFMVWYYYQSNNISTNRPAVPLFPWFMIGKYTGSISVWLFDLYCDNNISQPAALWLLQNISVTPQSNGNRQKEFLSLPFPNIHLTYIKVWRVPFLGPRKWYDKNHSLVTSL